MPQNSNFSFEPTKTFFVGEKSEGKLCFTAPEDYTKLLEGTISVIGIIKIHGSGIIQGEKHKFFSGKMKLNLHEPEKKKRLVLKDGKKVKWLWSFPMPDALPSSLKHKTVECAYYLEASLTTSTHKKPYHTRRRIQVVTRANPDDYVPETLGQNRLSAKDVVIRCTPDHACYYPNQTGTVNISIDNPSGKVIEKVTSSLVCKCRFQRTASFMSNDKTKYRTPSAKNKGLRLPIFQTRPDDLKYFFTVPNLALCAPSCSSQCFKNYWYLKLEFHIQHHLNIKVKVPLKVVASTKAVQPSTQKPEAVQISSEPSLKKSASRKSSHLGLSATMMEECNTIQEGVEIEPLIEGNQQLQDLYKKKKTAPENPVPDLIEFSPHPRA